jgi:hypothetical protein
MSAPRAGTGGIVGSFALALSIMIVPGAGAPATTAAQELSAKQAVEFLAATLTGECGHGTSFGTSAQWSVESRITGLRVEDAVLYLERSSIVRMELVHPSLRQTESGPRLRRVRLADLWADAELVPDGGRPGSESRGPGLTFECQNAGCVVVDGSAESALEISVCPERAVEVLRAMQILILQAGGRRR